MFISIFNHISFWKDSKMLKYEKFEKSDTKKEAIILKKIKKLKQKYNKEIKRTDNLRKGHGNCLGNVKFFR